MYTNERSICVWRLKTMKDRLIKAMQHNQLVNMMYITKSGVITKRYIKIIKIVNSVLLFSIMFLLLFHVYKERDDTELNVFIKKGRCDSICGS